MHPNIKTGWLKSWRLVNTFHLYVWPLIFYFLPDLSDFSAANTFVSSRHWLTYLTLAPFSTSKKGREKDNNRTSWASICVLIWLRAGFNKHFHPLKMQFICKMIKYQAMLPRRSELLSYGSGAGLLLVLSDPSWLKSIRTRPRVFHRYNWIFYITIIQIHQIWITLIR